MLDDKLQKEHGGEPCSFCWCSKLPQALLAYAPAIFLSCGGILSHALKRMTTPSAEGAKGGFRLCGRGGFASAEARRWLSDRPRHPFGRSPAYRLVSGSSVGRSRRLCQPP